MNGIVFFIVALVLCIVVGYTFKINCGILALVCAFLIGIFYLDLRVNQIMVMWPNSLFIMIVGVSLFYSFAIDNGTIEKLAAWTVWVFRGVVPLIPFVLFVFCAVLAGIGAGPYAVFLFMTPLVLNTAKQAGFNSIIAAGAVLGGGAAGGMSPISIGGSIIANLADGLGFGDQADVIVNAVFRNTCISQFIMLALLYFGFKGYRVRRVELERPQSLAIKQRLTLVVIILALCAVLLPPILNRIFPNFIFISMLARKLDITVIAFCGTVLCLVLRLGDERGAIKRVPWDVLLVICGMGTLINLAADSHIIDSLSQWINSSFNSRVIPYMLSLASSAMGLFSSTLGVVVPTLSILIPAIHKSNALAPGLLFSLISCPAFFAGYSPFSTGGALVLSSMQGEAERKKMMLVLFAISILSGVFFLLLVFSGLVY